MRINLYNLIKDNKNICVKLKDEFKNKVFNEIISQYGSLGCYQKIRRNNIKFVTLRALFIYGNTTSLNKILTIIDDLQLSERDLFNNILYFQMYGSKAKTFIPRYIKIDENFVKGYSLYIAEGDTGLNGKTIPSKLNFSNTDLPIIFYFREILLNYFKQRKEDLKYYIYLPKNYSYSIQDFCRVLKTNDKNLHIYYADTVTMPKYRISIERKLIITLFLKLDKFIKNICLTDTKLASAYLEGLSAGEGTAYCNKMKYVRIEMKNEPEMKYISILFNILNINHTLNERNTRKGMWYLYISRKENLDKFAELIGFKLCQKRQDVLNNIIKHYS